MRNVRAIKWGHVKLAIFILLSTVFLQGCPAFNYGATALESENRFWLVMGDKNNFADKRIGYVMGYCSTMKGFIERRGRPDMFYEYTSKGRAGIRLYYVKRLEVYDFLEANWHPDSRYLHEHRPMSFEEYMIYVHQVKESHGGKINSEDSEDTDREEYERRKQEFNMDKVV